VTLFSGGAPAVVVAEQRARIFKGEGVSIAIDLALGTHADEFHTCDLTEEYIRVNAEYTT
jgi:N-acetylglutamate synthase/N-acetylornithine aminotransferase